jgi:hypothetical protein
VYQNIIQYYPILSLTMKLLTTRKSLDIDSVRRSAEPCRVRTLAGGFASDEVDAKSKPYGRGVVWSKM